MVRWLRSLRSRNSKSQTIREINKQLNNEVYTTSHEKLFQKKIKEDLRNQRGNKRQTKSASSEYPRPHTSRLQRPEGDKKNQGLLEILEASSYQICQLQWRVFERTVREVQWFLFSVAIKLQLKSVSIASCHKYVVVFLVVFRNV